MDHHFTVDVEEYFQVAAFDGVVARRDWPTMASRVELQVLLLLELLAVRRARGTFFFLGCVGEEHPNLVRRVVAAGHEVASHGWNHVPVDRQDRAAFRQDARRSKQVLEDIGGAPVIGFRAPSFSMCPWAFDVLAEEGYEYDSSVCPGLRVDGRGHLGAERHPHWVGACGALVEYPPAVYRRFGVALPAGGAYFRALPYLVTRGALRDCERLGVPGTFYMHPWELDPDQPRIAASWWARTRHYTALSSTQLRLERLLAEFRFGRVCDTRLAA
jgi:polysaccharide deacetylase family protein (PEP-CTERM system associated)